MKIHKPLPIPKDSAWNRPSWKKHIPYWAREIVHGISNIIKWAPIIYKDRNWDDHYIFEILKFKLLQQREELVNANRHTGIEETNRYITICLNLIEHIQNETYGTEYQDYVREKIWSESTKDGTYALRSEIVFENFSGYFLKYQNQTRRLLKKDPELGLPENKQRLALRLGNLNQYRCQTLLFKILGEKINHWWD